MNDVPEYGENWFQAKARLSRPIDRQTAMVRLGRGEKIAILFPSIDGRRSHVVHDPVRDYLRVDITGWPDDPRNACSLRYSTVPTGELSLVEVGIYSRVPDQEFGDRAFWNQYLHVLPVGHERAILDLPAGGTRLIKSLSGTDALAQLSNLRFPVPDIDGYGSLIRPDLVQASMFGLDAFDPALGDVMEIRPDDIPPEPAPR